MTEPIGKIIERVLDELKRAQEKHPVWPEDPVYAAAIVAEEAGELLQAALGSVTDGKHAEKIHNEAIQVTAMGLRFLLNHRENP